jgi:hypothetical protein
LSTPPRPPRAPPAANIVHHFPVCPENAETGAREPERGIRGLSRSAARVGYSKMLTARAATSRMASEEIADSASISSFAQRLSGIASVGLKAIELVKET